MPPTTTKCHRWTRARDPPSAATPRRTDSLAGLHAKAYVLDRRSGSHLFVGSANATEAGFGGNVELLVEFEGPQPKLGVNALLGEASGYCLTVPYEPVGDVEPPADEEADYRLEQTLRVLAVRPYHCEVTIAHGALLESEGPEPQYGILVSADEPTPSAPDLTARVNLLTRPASTARCPECRCTSTDWRSPTSPRSS